jgi:hypothetical protein
MLSNAVSIRRRQLGLWAQHGLVHFQPLQAVKLVFYEKKALSIIGRLNDTCHA